MTALALTDLTQATLEGNGVFDTLMRANKAHLESEFNKGRLKGPEYATVYLGSLQSVMSTALAFITQRERIGLEALLLEQQVVLATLAVQKANAELAIITASLAKIPAEIAQLTAQTALVTQQTANAVIEATVLTAQKNKLVAELELVTSTVTKSAAEILLLNQKTATEKAQVSSVGVDVDSVVGRQKVLYLAQSDGFTRDAEQKVAKMMIDTWNVRRTTDEGTVADTTNMLSDSNVGRAVVKALAGIGLT